MNPAIWDMHVHLDFMRDVPTVMQEAEALGLGMLACTVTPARYERMAQVLSGAGHVRLGVGLHPWWLADGRCGTIDVARVTELVRTTRYVGEVGLDFSSAHVPAGSQEVQLSGFATVAQACAQVSNPAQPHVLSCHAVRAATQALDILQDSGALVRCTCIFHWFSGTSDELHRALKAGCLFSVNEMMLRTRRGREYARQLPDECLLLETDLPPGEDVPFSAQEIVDALERTVTTLAEIRHATPDEIRKLTTANAERILLGR